MRNDLELIQHKNGMTTVQCTVCRAMLGDIPLAKLMVENGSEYEAIALAAADAYGKRHNCPGVPPEVPPLKERRYMVL